MVESAIANNRAELSASNAIYLGWVNGDGHPNVNVSHDRGLTWGTSYDVGASSLPEGVKARLLARPDQRITAEGVIVIKAQEHRSRSMNLAEARVEQDDSGLCVSFAEHRLRLDGAALARCPALRGYLGQKVVVGIRPETLNCIGQGKTSPSVATVEKSAGRCGEAEAEQ